MKIINYNQLPKNVSKLLEPSTEGLSIHSVDQDLKKNLTQSLDANQYQINQAEHQFISILMADLRGFTYMVERVAPKLIIELLNEYLSTMVEIVDKHGGRVDKFLGDSIMALFDATSNTADGNLNILICAIEMQIAMENVNKKSKAMGLDNLYMGIGINTGEVIAGILGSDIYREYTVIGSHVNLASRIESHSLRGQILISENTYTYTKNSIETGEVKEVSAKGMRDPLRFYELKAVNSPVRLELPKRENRKGPRIQITIPVFFQLLVGKSVLPEVYEGKIIDISYGGILIATDKKINPFEDIKLSINLSLFGASKIDIYAKALYVFNTEEGADVGFEFTIIDDAASQVIKTFVDNLI